MKEMLVFALVALLSEAVVPGLTQVIAARHEAEAPAVEDEMTEAVEEEDSSELERLETENRILRELLVEKELALRGEGAED